MDGIDNTSLKVGFSILVIESGDNMNDKPSITFVLDAHTSMPAHLVIHADRMDTTPLKLAKLFIAQSGDDVCGTAAGKLD